MIIDLHSHTKYSWCGKDEPEELVKKMIDCGVQIFGICDHNYGIGAKKKEYFEELTALKNKYADKITILRGVEICTVPPYELKEGEDVSYFDYCLVENLGSPDSIMKDDVVSYCEKIGIKMGIAHTDLAAFCEAKGLDVQEYMRTLAEKGIYWELNVNYDLIHKYREHQYVKDFLANKNGIQTAVKNSGIEISVGFDGHRLEEYCVARVADTCDFLEKNSFKIFKG